MASCRAIVKSQLSFHAEIFRELLSGTNTGRERLIRTLLIRSST